MKKRIVLCADDYGQALAISQGIIELIKKGRLSATSCMANMPLWSELGHLLLPFREQVDLGLHFNLTEGVPLSSEYIQQHGESFQPLPRLLYSAFMRRLSPSAIEAECHAQLDSFQAVMGFLPDYLDGHHHIHQLPVIRDAVLRVYQQRLQSQHAYVRLVTATWKPVRAKMFVISAATQSSAFKKRLDRENIQYNRSFGGIYPFSQAGRYAQLFRGFLNVITEKGLIMCHPSLVPSQVGDSIARARYEEYQYLASDLFLADCERYNTALARYHG